MSSWLNTFHDGWTHINTFAGCVNLQLSMSPVNPNQVSLEDPMMRNEMSKKTSLPAVWLIERSFLSVSILFRSLWMSGMSAMCLSSISCVTPNGPFLDLVPSPISLPRSPLSPYHHCTNLTPNHYSHQPMTICLPQPLIPEEPQTPDEPQVFLGKSISMNFPPNLRAP